jgi:hypothetical protein
MPPEGNPFNPDDDDAPDDADEDKTCPEVADIFRARTESLPGDDQ